MGFLGVNAVDDFIADRQAGNNSPEEIVAGVVGVGLATARGDGEIGGKEERRVIAGSEAAAAGRLGEPTRTNHYGIPVITEGPTSKKKVDYPSDIKLKFLIKAMRDATQGRKN